MSDLDLYTCRYMTEVDAKVNHAYLAYSSYVNHDGHFWGKAQGS